MEPKFSPLGFFDAYSKCHEAQIDSCKTLNPRPIARTGFMLTKLCASDRPTLRDFDVQQVLLISIIILP